ncbi:unnamed protein product, partial [Urochloa humidicola]
LRSSSPVLSLLAAASLRLLLIAVVLLSLIDAGLLRPLLPVSVLSALVSAAVLRPLLAGGTCYLKLLYPAAIIPLLRPLSTLALRRSASAAAGTFLRRMSATSAPAPSINEISLKKNSCDYCYINRFEF